MLESIREKCEFYDTCGDPTSKTYVEGPQVYHGSVYCGKLRGMKKNGT